MPARARKNLINSTKKNGPQALAAELQAALTLLKSHSSRKTLASMARYAIPSDNALGVSMTDLKLLAKHLGRNHDLAEALWRTGVYEARMLASLIADPQRFTSAQLDRWCKDFDNWAICDTVCFVLFDRTPYAWQKVAKWSKRREEFIKRAGFALLWSLTVHDKLAGDEAFLRGLVFIEEAANDDRNFVKKAVNMALRAVGKRNQALNTAAVVVARRLAESPNAAARWVGRDALRELTSAAVIGRIRKRAK